MRAPALITAPSSTKQGPCSSTPSSARTVRTRSAGSPKNGCRASGSGTTHEGHDDSTSNHAAGGHSGDHAGNGSRTTAAGDFDGITSSDTARRLLTRANSTTLLISLALCVGLGILGGTVLRATGSR